MFSYGTQPRPSKWEEIEQTTGPDAIKFVNSPGETWRQVREAFSEQGFNLGDPETARIALKEYRKQPNDLPPASRASRAASAMAAMREEYRKKNPGQADAKWPPAGPPRYGDPLAEFEKVITGHSPRAV